MKAAQGQVRFSCPSPQRRKPAGKGVEWFLAGRGREKWATGAEAAAMNGVSLATLARDARQGCPQSVRVGGRVFYRRACLGSPSCWLFYEAQELREQSPEEKAAAREKRRIEKERRRAEWMERRAARERHKVRVDHRHAVLMAYKAKWQQSEAPWRLWIKIKKALKSQWEQEEALELGRDELRIEGKPLDAPGADTEAYRRGWKIIGIRMGNRLVGGA